MSKPSILRLQKEYKQLQSSKTATNFKVEPHTENLFIWYFVIYGLKDCPYEDGFYLGKISFPEDYPFKPPAISMLSKSGRFKLNRPICFSFSNFHPELWSPVWSVQTILMGFISFMNSQEHTVGGLLTNDETKIKIAKEESLNSCNSNPMFKELFTRHFFEMGLEQDGMNRLPS